MSPQFSHGVARVTMFIHYMSPQFNHGIVRVTMLIRFELRGKRYGK